MEIIGTINHRNLDFKNRHRKSHENCHFFTINILFHQICNQYS